MKTISLDCETTGIDFAFGARPYLVTTCERVDGEYRTTFWEWRVDPYTRVPAIPAEDVLHIQSVIDAADIVVLANAKFDQHALHTIGAFIPWPKVRDTLYAGHLLATNHGHALDEMCVEYLGSAELAPLEATIKEAASAARAIVRRDYPDWKIAREDDPSMPSVSGSNSRDEDKPWKNDMWLPRALIAQWDAEGHPIDDPSWLTACQDYANGDSSATLPLWEFCEAEIKRRGLWKIYLERLKLLPIVYDMEERGTTLLLDEVDRITTDFSVGVEAAQIALREIAAGLGHNLVIPEGDSVSDNLREVFWGSVTLTCPRCGTVRRVKHWDGKRPEDDPLCHKCDMRKSKAKPAYIAKNAVKMVCDVTRNPCLNLQPVISPKTGNPTLDGDALDHYVAVGDDHHPDASRFADVLTGMRVQAKAISAANTYRRFAIPHVDNPRYAAIHSNFNPVGTDHLRWSNHSPNTQNVSAREEDDDDGGATYYGLRGCFGPAPGREWWSMDFDNLELRIPGYECGEPKMLEIFERPDEPPYWGSYHCLVASILYPTLYMPLAAIKNGFKKKHPEVYTRTKRVNFAKNYGAGRKKIDAVAKVYGAYDTIDRGLPLMAALQRSIAAKANRLGYVETIPDRTVDPERGYPILVSRREDGRVKETTPFNYHVSGTALQCTNKAMVRCEERLHQWRRNVVKQFNAYIVMQVHDELVFDFPYAPNRGNLARANELRALMARSGDDIGVVTSVSMRYCERNWYEVVSV